MTGRHKLGAPRTTGVYSSRPGGWTPRSGCRGGWDGALGGRLLTWWMGRGAPGAFQKGTDPTREGFILMSSAPPEGPPPHTIPLRVSVSAYGRGGTTCRPQQGRPPGGLCLSHPPKPEGRERRCGGLWGKPACPGLGRWCLHTLHGKSSRVTERCRYRGGRATPAHERFTALG